MCVRSAYLIRGYCQLLGGEQEISLSSGSQSPTERKPPADCRGMHMYDISKADARLAARMSVTLLKCNGIFVMVSYITGQGC